MPEFKDRYDLPVTTASRTALDHYVEGLDRILMTNAKPEVPLTKAIAADEAFALPHVALAVVQQSAGRPDEAKHSIAKAQGLIEQITEREQSQLLAVAAAVEGNVAGALDRAHQHLEAYPRDAFVLRQTRFWLNQSGRRFRMEEGLALSEACESQYGDDPWFLCHHSFMHNELFHFEKARGLAERSFAQNRRNCECAHSLAHVFFETGDFSSGRDFLDGWLDGSEWQQTQRGHLSWHQALFELEAGNWPAVTRIYEDVIQPERHPGNMQIVLADSASLLWRFRINGKSLPSHAVASVVEFGSLKFPRAGNAFADAHKALALALASDADAIDRLAAEARSLVAQGRLPAGAVIPALIEAIGAFGAGDYYRTISVLEPHSDEIVRVGGSHAQFDVFNETLLAAYMRAGNAEKAAPLLRRRLDRRPSQRDETMLRSLQEAPPQQV